MIVFTCLTAGNAKTSDVRARTGAKDAPLPNRAFCCPSGAGAGRRTSGSEAFRDLGVVSSVFRRFTKVQTHQMLNKTRALRRGRPPPPTGSRCCSFGLTCLKQKPVLIFDVDPIEFFVLKLSTKLFPLPGRRNGSLFNCRVAPKWPLSDFDPGLI